MTSIDWINALQREGVDRETAERFLEWHLANREPWREFQQRAIRLCETTSGRVSAKWIVEAIRAETKLSISNSITAYYVRVFEIKNPQFRGRFKKNSIKGLSSSPNVPAEQKQGDLWAR